MHEVGPREQLQIHGAGERHRHGEASRTVVVSDEEIARIYDEYAEPYKNSPFSIEAVALKWQKFPTVESYKKYFQISRSYKMHLWEEMRASTVEKSAEEIAERARAKQQEVLADREKNPQEGATQSADELYQEIYESQLGGGVTEGIDLEAEEVPS